jgi:hypothetical protein
MSNTDIPIPVEPVSKTKTATKIQLSVPQFVLNATEMDVYVTFFSEEMQFVDSALVHIPPEVYKDWGTDDNHIVEYVLSKLNIHSKNATKKPEEKVTDKSRGSHKR